ncbi:T9SS type A sorting domain-containing protein [Lewinella sp. JB7]|uniref:T9SS type A sorting domain-containing protein n=1 Tax=Lewinella sp. JB7 TaxID=2962887 RepID=UPI0020CA2155|nr:T9SS type A sorting domain-containing protein [Lewinella sp. JB7]MCP9234879.1 T9SS type A sorting domain-containing protein [Lewinella sp. JB7]
MQRFYLFFLWGLLGVPGALSAQKIISQPLTEHGGCYLPPAVSEHTISRPYAFRDAVRPKALTYSINYVADGGQLNGRNCTTWPEAAKTAFEYGTSIWSDVLQNDQTINVDACYSPDLSGGTLGSASASLRAIGPVGSYDYVVYPQALAENLLNTSLSGADISVYINANFAPNFYFGTDAAPPNDKIDFVTLTVHELGHGLGFSGSARIDDGVDTTGTGAQTECDGVNGSGCLGYFFDPTGTGAAYYPTIYDIFADRGSDQTALLSITPHPGPDYATAFTGGSGGVFYDESNLDEFAVGTNTFQLYTPATFQPGSSFSHFNDNTEVMYYSLSYGNAVHDVGNAAVVMQNMGWPAATAAPVTLISFTGAAGERGVELEWLTATEVNNAAFDVEASRDGSTFAAIGRLPGKGTTDRETSYSFRDATPTAGTNHYRLRQVDFDGSVTYGPVIGVEFAVDDTRLGLAYPNPTSDRRVTLDYLTPRARELSVTVIDGAGRLLEQRNFAARAGRNRLGFDLADYVPGLYVLRVDDGQTANYRRVIVR